MYFPVVIFNNFVQFIQYVDNFYPISVFTFDNFIHIVAEKTI